MAGFCDNVGQGFTGGVPPPGIVVGMPPPPGNCPPSSWSNRFISCIRSCSNCWMIFLSPPFCAFLLVLSPFTAAARGQCGVGAWEIVVGIMPVTKGFGVRVGPLGQEPKQKSVGVIPPVGVGLPGVMGWSVGEFCEACRIKSWILCHAAVG